MKRLIFIWLFFSIFLSCKKETPESVQTLTVFHVNDVHGQIDNFSKIKYIIDKERETGNVIVCSAGDIFSGNPVVNIYTPKGYPMIDIMNAIGFDIMAIMNSITENKFLKTGRTKRISRGFVQI
jgi:5'-nucleotidase / UDP-sugar diphosphatase